MLAQMINKMKNCKYHSLYNFTHQRHPKIPKKNTPFIVLPVNIKLPSYNTHKLKTLTKPSNTKPSDSAIAGHPSNSTPQFNKSDYLLCITRHAYNLKDIMRKLMTYLSSFSPKLAFFLDKIRRWLVWLQIALQISLCLQRK